jgi:hypothetical protein
MSIMQIIMNNFMGRDNTLKNVSSFYKGYLVW